MKLEISAEARQDFRDIYAFVEARRPGHGQETVARIVRRLEQIEAFPRSGSIARPYSAIRVRQLIEGHYRILYSVGTDTILVLAAVHVSRSL